MANDVYALALFFFFFFFGGSTAGASSSASSAGSGSTKQVVYGVITSYTHSVIC